MADPFEIIVGTYEHYLLGYKVDIVNEYKMERTFATHSHFSSLRSIASNKHYLASGGDDSVFLYDMRYRVESGRLMHHNDTVNCVAFTPEASHLFTCSNDGNIAAIRCGNWQMEKQWPKAHKGFAVNNLAIHPTGKIALSTGADGILRTWNLVKGRQAYATNLVPRLKLDAKNVTVLKWSPNGEKYLLAVNERIDVYSVALAGIDNEIMLHSKINCVEFLRDDLIAVGLENGQIKFYDLEKSVQTVEAVAHDIRVKCMTVKDDLLITASSSGEIKLWRYSKYKLDILQSVTCGARITCVCLAMPCKNLKHKEETKLEDTIDPEEEEREFRKKKMKFRLRQEVTIEDEGAWKITPVRNPQTESLKTHSKKKRSIEEIEVTSVPDRKKKKSILKKKKLQDSAIDGVPVKKKKLINTEHINNNFHKKRKENLMPLEENNNLSVKKVKKVKKVRKLKGKTSGTESVSLNGSKRKLTHSEETDDVRPKKKKKKVTT